MKSFTLLHASVPNPMGGYYGSPGGYYIMAGHGGAPVIDQDVEKGPPKGRGKGGVSKGGKGRGKAATKGHGAKYYGGGGY